MMKEFFVFEGTNPKRSQFVKLTNIVEKKNKQKQTNMKMRRKI